MMRLASSPMRSKRLSCSVPLEALVLLPLANLFLQRGPSAERRQHVAAAVTRGWTSRASLARVITGSKSGNRPPLHERLALPQWMLGPVLLLHHPWWHTDVHTRWKACSRRGPSEGLLVEAHSLEPRAMEGHWRVLGVSPRMTHHPVRRPCVNLEPRLQRENGRRVAMPVRGKLAAVSDSATPAEALHSQQHWEVPAFWEWSLSCQELEGWRAETAGQTSSGREQCCNDWLAVDQRC
mmetsp:Transcript_144479/g.254786  ORF Transcript_144479/g.254786 Transcript_144479/m.254786 type:complete len:237 (+) Transcript_144479:3655-4365(+)